ncbi:winged helix-turn-helix domain-containing protein [Streptomyces hirsutus]|uniref:winged helix-turn-helix domain-containing protein n=1 Tax=Streptomyces hirsutus TaxID=35620 RepID=UPI003638ED6B
MYETLRTRVEDGTYPPDSRVPSIVQVAEEFNVAQVTAQKALKALRAEGYTYTEPGIGSFVRGK